MARPKQDLTKKTLNLRPGDFEAMGELFPGVGASNAIRNLVAGFVDKYANTESPDPETPLVKNLNF